MPLHRAPDFGLIAVVERKRKLVVAGKRPPNVKRKRSARTDAEGVGSWSPI